MFKFSLLDELPHKRGIEPDAKNAKAETYIEERLTKYLTHNKKSGKKIKALSGYYVAFIHFLDDTPDSWIITDGVGVLKATSHYETLLGMCDVMKIVHGNELF